MLEESDRSLPRRGLLIALTLFSSVSAIGGGYELILWRAGDSFVPLSLLEYTPFATFLVPGILLAAVVGGTSLVAAMLAIRRAPGTIDATILAGGALTVWIVAELAMLRQIHWLHVLYGALGLAILGLGVAGARALRQRWTVIVTAGEALGYMAPAMAGILSVQAGLSEAAQAGLVVAGGFVEGLALGLAQARALPLAVDRRRYALLTSLAAGGVWAAVMSTRLLIDVDVPVALLVVAFIVVGVFGLGAIGGAQWLELRRHAPRAWPWIGWTALAWVVGLPLSFAPGPFVDESTPLFAHVGLWGSGGIMMAYVMSLITWRGVRALMSEETRIKEVARA